MEIAKELNGFWVECYSKEDLNTDKNVKDEMTKIISSYERSTKIDYFEALQDLEDKLQDFLTFGYLDAKLYLLRSKVDSSAVGFALYSKDEKLDSIHLEMIYTHCQRRGSGFGEVLLTQSCKDLQKKGFDMVTSTVENNNKASMAMHDSFAKNENVKLYRNSILFDRTEFEVDISNINTPKMEADDAFEF